MTHPFKNAEHSITNNECRQRGTHSTFGVGYWVFDISTRHALNPDAQDHEIRVIISQIF